MKVKFLVKTRCNGKFVNVGDIEEVNSKKGNHMVMKKVAEAVVSKSKKSKKKENTGKSVGDTGPEEDFDFDGDSE